MFVIELCSVILSSEEFCKCQLKISLLGQRVAADHIVSSYLAFFYPVLDVVPQNVTHKLSRLRNSYINVLYSFNIYNVS